MKEAECAEQEMPFEWKYLKPVFGMIDYQRENCPERITLGEVALAYYHTASVLGIVVVAGIGVWKGLEALFS
jgi:hypothetical protein